MNEVVRGYKRQELLDTLEHVWSKNPDFRFGQILSLALAEDYFTGEGNSHMFLIPDKDFLSGLRKLDQRLDKGE